MRRVSQQDVKTRRCKGGRGNVPLGVGLLVAGGSFWRPCEGAPDLSRAAEYTRRVAAVAAAGALVGVAVAVWFVRWARRPVGTRRQRRRAEQEKLVS